MKVYVLGKSGSIVHWPEHTVAGFRAAGHDVQYGITRDPRLHPVINELLVSRALGAPRAAALCRAIRRFSPDLILAVGPYGMSDAILEHVARMSGRPPFVGWVGDIWYQAPDRAANCLDAIAYTDTGLLARHHDEGLSTRAIYLPHAVSPRLDGIIASGVRRQRMVFVANPTDRRRELIEQITSPVTLYGLGWTQQPSSPHEVHARRIGATELQKIYSSFLAVLNIRNEGNVLTGLNQRNFDPYNFATPVISDDQCDLASCFEPGREVFVYRDANELNEIYREIRDNPARAISVGQAGQRRVLAHHTYGQRLDALATLTGVSKIRARISP